MPKMNRNICFYELISYICNLCVYLIIWWFHEDIANQTISQKKPSNYNTNLNKCTIGRLFQLILHLLLQVFIQDINITLHHTLTTIFLNWDAFFLNIWYITLFHVITNILNFCVLQWILLLDFSRNNIFWLSTFLLIF